MIHLKEGSFLQGGRYRVEKVLGQGGFGITYLGVQVGLNRQVAIKEFFMKEYCERDKDTSHVSLGTSGSRAMVERFRQKFVKEAQTISGLSHPNIIRIYDVFEENGTAYYVMEYHGHGSLSDLVKQRNRLDEADAVGYIRQIGEALRYIHEHKINHLDVKPGNVLLDDNGRAVLIDFGMSKRYDAAGEQTSTTPVGISHGYAPLEQYKQGGVGMFSPATDIYSLGATLYKLVTGITPPDASELDEGGLSSFPGGVSDKTKQAIRQTMNTKRKDRPQYVDAFLALLDNSDDAENTIIDVLESPSPVPEPKSSSRKWLLPLAFVLVVALGILGMFQISGNDEEPMLTDSLSRVATVPAVPSVVDNPVLPAKADEKVVATIPAVLPVAENPVPPAKTDEKVTESVPIASSLYVSTSPVGATVYLDGKEMGNSPLEGKEVSRGKHTIKLVLDGYEPFSKQYTFGDKPVIINETLVPVRISVQEEPSKPVTVVSTSSTINGHAYVDLGLSVKWATMNVGATSPGGYGDYFAWGEVRTKSAYTEKNSQTYNKEIGEISGNSQYDVARCHWGSSWRLPTQGEFQELIDKCRWTWTKENGHVGYKIEGPNGNSIFLPAAGYCKGTSTSDEGAIGLYWSSSPDESYTKYAYHLYFDAGNRYVNWGNRSYGRSVRPVSD